MNAKISVFVICVETIMYLLLYDLRDCDFNFWIVKTILSYFFQALLPPKVPFTSSESIFFNESLIPASGNVFFV